MSDACASSSAADSVCAFSRSPSSSAARAVALVRQQLLNARALALDLGAAPSAFGGNGAVHFLAQPRRGLIRGLLHLVAQAGRRVRDRALHLGAELCRRFCCRLFHVAAHFIARTRHGLSACGFELAANPIGFRDDPAVGFGGGIGKTCAQTALRLFPDRVEFFAVTICRVIGSTREVLNLASRTLGLGGQPTLGFRLRSGELGLQTPIPLGSYGFDRC